MSDKIIQLNEAAVKSELKELVRKSVDELTGAAKYERNESRQGHRSAGTTPISTKFLIKSIVI